MGKEKSKEFFELVLGLVPDWSVCGHGLRLDAVEESRKSSDLPRSGR